MLLEISLSCLGLLPKTAHARWPTYPRMPQNKLNYGVLDQLLATSGLIKSKQQTFTLIDHDKTSAKWCQWICVKAIIAQMSDTWNEDSLQFWMSVTSLPVKLHPSFIFIKIARNL